MIPWVRRHSLDALARPALASLASLDTSATGGFAGKWRGRMPQHLRETYGNSALNWARLLCCAVQYEYRMPRHMPGVFRVSRDALLSPLLA